MWPADGGVSPACPKAPLPPPTAKEPCGNLYFQHGLSIRFHCRSCSEPAPGVHGRSRKDGRGPRVRAVDMLNLGCSRKKRGEVGASGMPRDLAKIAVDRFFAHLPRSRRISFDGNPNCALGWDNENSILASKWQHGPESLAWKRSRCIREQPPCKPLQPARRTWKIIAAVNSGKNSVIGKWRHSTSPEDAAKNCAGNRIANALMMCRPGGDHPWIFFPDGGIS